MSDNKYPWFWFYPADFLASQKVRVMTTTEVGAYFTLLCYAWMNEPSAHLPNDEEHLRELCRMTAEEWAVARRHIMACWQPTDDGKLLYNPRLLKVRQEAERFSALQRSRAGKRWQCRTDSGSMPDHAADMPSGGNAGSMPDHATSHSHPDANTRTPLPPFSPKGGGAASQTAAESSDGNQVPVVPADESTDSKPTANQEPRPPAAAGDTAVRGRSAERMTAAEHEVVEAWNALGEPFAKVRHLGHGTRRRYLKARLLDSWWCEHWRDALAKLATIPGMRGQNNRGSPVDFLFFVRADSVAKIVEGKYDTWGQAKVTPSGKGTRRSSYAEEGKFDGPEWR